MTGRDQGRLDEADAAIGQKTSGVRADAGSPTAMDALLKNVKVQYGRHAGSPLERVAERAV